MFTCLVTGGLGYIGSHICVELLENNFQIIILDNLSNSKIDKLDIIKKSNKINNKIMFYNIDLVEFDNLYNCVENIYKQYEIKIDIIIHLAGLIAVSESVEFPIKYYNNNLISTLNLTKIMELFGIKNLIFSSSATVYGNSICPYFENTLTGKGITNPYGRSKFIQEEMLKDISNSHVDWNIYLLRYFNPIGHINKDLAEDPNGIPNNLFPYLLKVYQGKLKQLTVFGSDYPNTKDGTCSRDFIHVVDLANAHVLCSKHMLDTNNNIGLSIYNVGTGQDTTVLELIKAFEKINQTKINYNFGSRRTGDLEMSYSNIDLIANKLGWKAKYTIEDCVKII